MTALFVDTSAWVALRDEDDARHSQARSAWQEVTAAGVPLVSTVAVLGETLTVLRRRASHRAAVEFGKAFRASPGLKRVDEDGKLHDRAWVLFQSRKELVLSYVDCLSFAVMERLALRQAFAFDADFQAMGFVLFPTSPLL